MFFAPIYLALLFILGENTAFHYLNNGGRVGMFLKNIETPKLYLVQSGSMEPAIGVGSVVLVTPDSNYVNGDIISFDLLGDGKNIVTHRISYKEFPNGISGEPVYVTKGDANNDFDPKKVGNGQIVGKVSLTIPYLGYLASYAKKPWGFILLIIVPATILIYEELKTVLREIGKLAKKKISRSDNFLKKYTPILKIGNFKEKILRSLSYVISLFGAGVVLISLSSAGFLDGEETKSNTFRAADSFVAQTSEVTPSVAPVLPEDRVVINEVYYKVASVHEIGSESDSEWVELYNSGDFPVDLNGWSVRDNTSCDNIIGEYQIPVHGYVIVAYLSKPLFESVWGKLPDSTIYIQLSGAIGNGLADNDELILKNSTCSNPGTIFDHISWGSNIDGCNPSIPTVSTNGISFERDPDGTDTNTNTDFIESNPPTPGS